MENRSKVRRLILGAAIGLTPLASGCKIDNNRLGTPEHRQYVSPECQALDTIVPYLYQLSSDIGSCSAFLLSRGLAVTPAHCIGEVSSAAILMHPVTLEAMSGVVSYKDAAADIALLEVEGQARGYQDDLCEDFEPESFTKDLIIAYSYQLPSGPQIYTHDVSYHGQNLDQIIIRHDKQGGYLQRGSSGGIVCMKRGDSYIPIGMMSAIMVDETDRARIAHMLNNDLTTYPLGIAVKLSECSQRAPQSAILCSK